MSNFTAPASTTTGAGVRARPRALTVTLWILQVLLAISFVFAGAQKLAGTQVMVDMFDTIGAGQWLRYAIGLVEVAGGIGLLIPRLSGLAALGLVGLMLGATVTNVLV